MSDPRDDELRRALRAGGDAFVPVAPLGATRHEVVGRVRRRQRQVASLAATATAVVVVAALVASGIGRSPGSSSRLVVAGGAGHATASTAAPTGGATPPTTGTFPAAGTGTGTGTGVSSGTIVSGGPHGTAPTPPTTRVTAPATTTPSTVPGATTTTTAPSSVGSAVRGSVLFSPTCPVEQVPPNPACAPRPGPAHIQLMRLNGSVAAEGDAGSNGQYLIPVAPGTYLVNASTVPASGAIGRGCTASANQVTVKPGSATTDDVACDTGIR